MGNLLLEDIEYVEETTSLGRWRRYLYESGDRFAEFRSHADFLGLPMIHYTYGRNPRTGKRVVARGVVAIGRLAVGFVAIGHASLGIVAIGQLAIGALFGLGQACTGIAAIGQLAIGALFGLGQFALGYVAIGQFATGHMVLAQLGAGDYVWDSRAAAPEAAKFFKGLIGK